MARITRFLSNTDENTIRKYIRKHKKKFTVLNSYARIEEEMLFNPPKIRKTLSYSTIRRLCIEEGITINKRRVKVQQYQSLGHYVDELHRRIAILEHAITIY
jgi:hypothetical protein